MFSSGQDNKISGLAGDLTFYFGSPMTQLKTVDTKRDFSY